MSYWPARHYRWLMTLGFVCAAIGACGDGSPRILTPPEYTSFTLVVLPDTQGYSRFSPDIYKSQTEWVVANRDSLEIPLVVHVGDLVEGSWLTEQWDVAVDALSILDGEVPYIIALGNHDYGAVYESRNARDRSTLFNQYFPRTTFEGMPTFGDFYPEPPRSDNSYHTFTMAQQSFLVLALEFGPRDEVVEWAAEVIDAHPDHLTIIATHAYLYSDDTRYDWAAFGDSQEWNPHSYGISSLEATTVNDGQELWNKLLSPRDNILAVLCGHVLNDGLGYARSQGASRVHEILANYQMNEFAGAGFLRLMHFDVERRTIHVRTYSPWTDSFKTDPANDFHLSY